MSTHISKGKAFRCTVTVDDDRLAAMKRAPENAEKALMAGADYWHTGILPKHFEKDAHDNYGYATRGNKYRFGNKRKRGKPDLVFSGSLRRDLRSKAAYRKVGTAVELKMSARVLNLIPRSAENSPDLFIKHKSGRGYPNLKREIKALTDEDRAQVAAVVQETLASLFDPSGSSSPAHNAPIPGAST